MSPPRRMPGATTGSRPRWAWWTGPESVLTGHAADERVVPDALAHRQVLAGPPLAQRHQAGLDQLQIAEVPQDLVVGPETPGAQRLGEQLLGVRDIVQAVARDVDARV